jgi:NAD(P)-dependent dehydrogenase (short-subunit alcohol dehydrogenase family)
MKRIENMIDWPVDLANQRVFVTGAGSGMGAAIAEAFARVGAKVAFADLDGEAIGPKVDVLRDEGCEVLVLVGDVSDRATVEEWAGTIAKEWGAATTLVNCAGIWSDVPFEELTLDEWQRVIDVNLTGTFHTCQLIGGPMRGAGGGSIINFSSLSGVRGFKRRTAYTVTKHGVIGLTRVIAHEWGEYGVRANAIGPGRFNTALAADKYANPAVVERFLERVPIGRTAEPAEMVGTIFFLASEMSAYITGQVLMVDGGFTAV